jgi:hypothetical protein
LGFSGVVQPFLVPGDRTISLPFTAVVDQTTNPWSPKGKLQQHVSRLFDRLASGKTAWSALDNYNRFDPSSNGANYAYPPRTIPQPDGTILEIDMLLVGDSRARLGSVYRTEQEELLYPGDRTPPP